MSIYYVLEYSVGSSQLLGYCLVLHSIGIALWPDSGTAFEIHCCKHAHNLANNPVVLELVCVDPVRAPKHVSGLAKRQVEGVGV